MEQEMAGTPQLGVPEGGKASKREADCHSWIARARLSAMDHGGPLIRALN